MRFIFYRASDEKLVYTMERNDINNYIQLLKSVDRIILTSDEKNYSGKLKKLEFEICKKNNQHIEIVKIYCDF